MYKKPIQPTTRRVVVQFIVFAFYMMFAIASLATTRDRYDWLNVLVAVLLLLAAYQQVIMSRNEKRAWTDYQAEDYRYTKKNQDYARRH
jgi:cell division protein FtsW (lipid II flippase)